MKWKQKNLHISNGEKKLLDLLFSPFFANRLHFFAKQSFEITNIPLLIAKTVKPLANIP
jgi:hypothetical protein